MKNIKDVKGISFPAALNELKSLVWASDRPVKEVFTCPGCEMPMHFREGSKRPHFAHNKGAHCSNPETALHRLAKKAIADGFSQKMANSEPYEIKHFCHFCTTHHSGDILRKGKFIEMEKRLGNTIPDLTIYDAKRKPLATIEIVVTHLPEPETIKAYRGSQIPALLLFPTWKTVENLRELIDIDATINSELLCKEWKRHKLSIRNELKKISELHSPELETSDCPKCQKALKMLKLSIYGKYPCYKCNHHFPIATFNENWTNLPNAKRICDYVNKFGGMLEETYSKTIKKTYLMNRCPTCKSKVGDFYLENELTDCTKILVREIGYCANCRVWHFGQIGDNTQREPDLHDQLTGRIVLERRLNEEGRKLPVPPPEDLDELDLLF